MITIEIEFTTKTVLGLSEAKVEKIGDIGEEMRRKELIEWVMKAVKHENVRRPMITFSYYDASRGHDVGTFRFITGYDEKVELITWNSRGNIVSHVKGVKIDKRLVTRLYDETLKCLAKTEEQVG